MRSILRMLYKNLIFPKVSNRPFFYTSFVATVDGKVYVNEKGLPAGRQGYWPIGDRVDYQTFTYLRAHADAIVDGKGTALRFGKNTIDTINSQDFKKLRESLNKTKSPQYIVLSKHKDRELIEHLKNPYQYKPLIFGKSVGELVSYLQKKGVRHVFIDGGPHLLGSFFEQDFIDEIFLTIAPRIFGNDQNAAITMVEGRLFPPHKIKLKLISMERVENEVFLRYGVQH